MTSGQINFDFWVNIYLASNKYRSSHIIYLTISSSEKLNFDYSDFGHFNDESCRHILLLSLTLDYDITELLVVDHSVLVLIQLLHGLVHNLLELSLCQV